MTTLVFQTGTLRNRKVGSPVPQTHKQSCRGQDLRSEVWPLSRIAVLRPSRTVPASTWNSKGPPLIFPDRTEAQRGDTASPVLTAGYQGRWPMVFQVHPGSLGLEGLFLISRAFIKIQMLRRSGPRGEVIHSLAHLCIGYPSSAPAVPGAMRGAEDAWRVEPTARPAFEDAAVVRQVSAGCARLRSGLQGWGRGGVGGNPGAESSPLKHPFFTRDQPPHLAISPGPTQL